MLENDMFELAKQREHGLIKLVIAAHTGITTEEFDTYVKEWIKTAYNILYK